MQVTTNANTPISTEKPSGDNCPRKKSVLADTILFVGVSALKAQWVLAGTYLGTKGGTVANLLLLLLIASLAAALRNRLRRGFLLGLVTLISAFLFSDILHYRALREFVSLSELGHATQLASGLSTILPYIRWWDCFIYADVAIWIWLVAKSWKNSRGTRIRFSVWFCLVLISAVAYSWAIADFVLTAHVNQPLDYNRRFVVREVGLLNFHVFDALNLRSRMPEAKVVKQPDLQLVREWFKSRQVLGAETLPFGVATGYNLIFIQVESLEAFVIGLKINGHAVTPNFNKLAAEGCYFPRFFPQTSLGNTSDAEYSALNSLLPAPTGALAWRNAKNNFWSLPMILKEHGYSTISMTVCQPDLWNMGWMHYAYGFQSRHYYDSFRVGREDPMKIDDRRFFTRARELLRSQPRPFFSHLLTISTHSPFTLIPENQKTFPLGSLEGSILGNYLQAAHFVDNAIDEFLRNLKADGLASNSVVFIYGDHEALPMDERQRARPFEGDLIGARLDEQLRRRVPLFVIVPGGYSTDFSGRIAGQIDLAPTALHLLGVPEKGAFFLGNNLFRTTDPLVYFRTGAFATERAFRPASDELQGEKHCEPMLPSTEVDEEECNRVFHQVLERINISDLILEQDMIPALRN